MRKALAATIASTGLIATVVVAAPAANAYPPDPPSVEETRQLLEGLTVEAEGSMDGYDRDLFPHWSNQGDNCDTRDVVLQRDGTDVEVDEDCEPTSGSWYSVYDGQTLNSQDDVQIDHIIALAEAWRSGAADWSNDEREAFANDLEHAQLIAVSGSSNSEKSDYDPSEWMPANENVHCVYLREWIWVKSVYDLTVDDAELAALNEGLDASC